MPGIRILRSFGALRPSGASPPQDDGGVVAPSHTASLQPISLRIPDCCPILPDLGAAEVRRLYNSAEDVPEVWGDFVPMFEGGWLDLERGVGIENDDIGIVTGC